ncbi:hypothetical protein HDV05_000719 [Chytridiales sp. JEL 0842]|nr:hypothetical protein HDV05_000719 [Chytridiales sp. JEL 0842]
MLFRFAQLTTTIFLVSTFTAPIIAAVPDLATIASLLPDGSRGFGVPCSDRSQWDPLIAADPKTVQAFITKAKSAGTMPPFNTTTYELFYKTGNRQAGGNMIKARLAYVHQLVLAECFEMKGNFKAAMEAGLQDLATQRTWVEASHDPKMATYNGTFPYVDLIGSYIVGTLSQALYMFGDVLTPAVKQVVSEQLQTRAIQPYLDRLQGKTSVWWWMIAKNNWNAVCHSGMIYAVLVTVADKNLRAMAVSKVAEQAQNYLVSYLDDGYATEGVSYYAYGGEAFAELRETLYQATQGKVDLYTQNPKVVSMAQFPQKFPMTAGQVAPFGDARMYDRFPQGLSVYNAWSFGTAPKGMSPRRGTTQGQVLNFFIQSLPPRSLSIPDIVISQDPLRSVFPNAQNVVMRSGASTSPNFSACKMDVTFKVAGNDGHSHDDIGSYTILVDNDFVMGDPGGPRFYEGRSFGPKRYESPIMNSIGHPVPLIAGQRQQESTSVLKTNPDFKFTTKFTPDGQDVVSADLAPAYKLAVPSLNSALRRVVFERSGEGSVEISDTINMNGGAEFEGVFTVIGTWTPKDAQSGLIVSKFGKKAFVTFSASAPFVIRTDLLSDYNVTWTRVALQIKSTKVEETFTIRVIPGDGSNGSASTASGSASTVVVNSTPTVSSPTVSSPKTATSSTMPPRATTATTTMALPTNPVSPSSQLPSPSTLPQITTSSTASARTSFSRVAANKAPSTSQQASATATTTSFTQLTSAKPATVSASSQFPTATFPPRMTTTLVMSVTTNRAPSSTQSASTTESTSLSQTTAGPNLPPTAAATLSLPPSSTTTSQTPVVGASTDATIRVSSNTSQPTDTPASNGGKDGDSLPSSTSTDSHITKSPSISTETRASSTPSKTNKTVVYSSASKSSAFGALRMSMVLTLLYTLLL